MSTSIYIDPIVNEGLVARSLELAARSVGLVSPNPLVGCLIESSDGIIVGKGTYTYEGVTHAEVIALEQAGKQAKGGTAYVSLEPHSHHGRTPPCTSALINQGIKRVVCPIEDPNPLVSGCGFDVLRKAGIEVVTGILADEATRLNEKFICWHKKQRPFVHLKMAMSLDGRISLGSSVSTALSGEEGRSFVQNLRHEYDAILVGGNTAFTDNPSLTDRSGRPRRRPLVRVVLDNSLRLPGNSILATTAIDTPTVLFTNSSDTEKISELTGLGVEVVKTENNGRDLAFVLNVLKERELQSVLVEGGSEIAGSFIDANLVDKVTFLIAPIVVGGHKAPVAVGGKGASSIDETLRLQDVTTAKHGDDIEITGYPTR